MEAAAFEMTLVWSTRSKAEIYEDAGDGGFTLVEMGKEEVEEANEEVFGRGGAHVAELPSVTDGREVLVGPVGDEALTQQAEQWSDGEMSKFGE